MLRIPRRGMSHNPRGPVITTLPGDELYGYMTLSKDWKDGVLSIIMRGMSKNFSDQVRHSQRVSQLS